MRFIPAKNFTPSSRTRVSAIGIHTAECQEHPAAAENVQAFFGNQPKHGAIDLKWRPDGKPWEGASAHYTVDIDSITQSVLEKDIAWHAGPANGFSIGIEHAGAAKQTAEEWEDEYSRAMLERSAELAADICRRHEIPVVRLTAQDLAAGRREGFFGHIDVTNGLQAGKGHWDPGPSFPWDHYLARVRAHLAREEPTVPELVVARTEDDVYLMNLQQFVEVEHAGVVWCVAPYYVAPVGIGEAEDLAAKMGCELPSPGLVDAIWRAADLRIDAAEMIRADHDGTPATMNSATMHASQAARLAELVGERSLAVDFRLLAGAFKDVVRHDGKVGLYGWHRADGSVVQTFYGGHARAWKDYSQGLRLCVRKK